MLRALGSTEYGEMLSDWLSEPRGEKRGDWQAALIAAMAIAPHTKNHKPPPLSDMLLKFTTEPQKEQSPQEMFSICQQIAARCNKHG